MGDDARNPRYIQTFPEKALENYRKALELRPEFSFVERLIQQLDQAE